MSGMTPVGARLFQEFRRGDRRALARAISMVENQAPGFQAFLHEALRGGTRARRVGFTGPPGAGKSTLVAAVALAARAAGEGVGVLAVDPSSPFSGGALLGDRIRMQELALDPAVFIRSMATRGSLGGLAHSSMEVLDLLDAFGFPLVLVETVGVGQTELEIAGTVDTTVVVLVPESGDSIQAMKAGLMEIGDIFVVNKADRPGARSLARDVRMSLHLRDGSMSGTPWAPPVLMAEGLRGEGVPELRDALDAHQQFLQESGELLRRRRARAEDRVRRVMERELVRMSREVMRGSGVAERLERLAEGGETPYSLASRLIEELLGSPPPRGIPGPE